MIYLYRRGSITLEQEFRMGEAPKFVMVGKHKYDREFVCNPVIPPYMKAAGSTGSSENSCDRQAVYLKSEKHRAQMKQHERIVQRQEASDASFTKAMREAQPKFDKAVAERIQREAVKK